MDGTSSAAAARMLESDSPTIDPLARTQWSRIHRLGEAGASDPEIRGDWEEAWNYLWVTFRPAMLRIVRRMLPRIGGGVVGGDEAEDVVQSFFLACLEKDYLVAADPDLGRFRTYVAVCLRRHTNKYVEYRRRKRRAPSAPLLSLSASAGGEGDPVARAWDAAFEMEWVRCLLHAALPRVGERSRPNEALLRVVCESPYISVDDLALRLGIDRSDIPLRLHRARRMLAQEFWGVVEQTVTSRSELEDEQASLGRALAHHLGVKNVPSLFG